MTHISSQEGDVQASTEGKKRQSELAERDSFCARGDHLVARANACPVGWAALNGREHHQLAAGGVGRNQQSHALHLPVRAHSKVCILPAALSEQ